MSTKFRGILFALLGVMLVGTGLFAVYELYRRSVSSSALEQQTQPVIVMTNVVIAARDVPMGKIISPEDVLLVELPAEAVPPSTLTRVEDAINRYVRVDLVTGEMIMVHKLADPTNVNNDFAFVLSEDHVMMAFPATDLMSKQNIIQRGDIVDLFATLTKEIKVADENGDSESITKLYTFDALQGTEITALVLKVIEDTSGTSQTNIAGSGSTENKRVQTETQAYLLALHPQDALTIKHLKDAGAVFDVVLRAPSSKVIFDLHPVTSEYVMELYKLENLK